MNLQTFKASTMAEALGQVKHVMGHDAVILHTRTYHTRYMLGLRRREIVEITAGRGTGLRPRRPAQRPAQQQQKLEQPVFPPRALVAASAQPTIVRDPIANGRSILEQPAAGTAVMLNLTQEMATLKGMVKTLHNDIRHTQAPQVPEELFEHYLGLIQSQVAEELASDIVKTLQKNLRPEHLSQPQFVREKLAEQLEKLLPTSGPIVRTKAVGPHVVALIGPTGVGKTTTLAKLAANLKLREKHRVGLITLDTYRIAAVDQLKKYADIIGSPLRVVGNIEDLKEAVAQMSDCDFILIDTAGRSPNDALKLNELKGLLDSIKPDEVHLVISSTASQACVELAVTKFSEVRVDKIIFTKIDEAAHVGTVLNVVRKVNKQLSYITTGQDVPDDIEVGRGRRLAQLILGNTI
ncbi:MAG: flagellar biosynthesis protein FlhF [Planctomycetota bacterium]|nr:flagellar biosynthesis protein FlhF [Planctomycetota bacterium]